MLRRLISENIEFSFKTFFRRPKNKSRPGTN